MRLYIAIRCRFILNLPPKLDLLNYIQPSYHFRLVSLLYTLA